MMKRYKLMIVMAVVGLIACNPGNPDSGQEPSIAGTIEAFKKALVEADAEALDQLTAASLTYGHSSGLIENKEEFISALVDGTSNFLDIRLSDQQVTTSGDVAIVRHQLDAETEDAGKPRATIRLHVLTVWQHAGGQWKLLARQAVKTDR